jgi:hypothetical protein
VLGPWQRREYLATALVVRASFIAHMPPAITFQTKLKLVARLHESTESVRVNYPDVIEINEILD